uniref:Tyr recombinase domain-containing protein n=1 Tax=Amphimedon queenslandica TaxID=400682 RepID=A0A1X7VD80_AMPQE
MFFACLEFSGAKVWQQINAFQDPELVRLAAALPDTLLKARADSTTKKYIGAYKRWAKQASTKRELSVQPVEAAQFVLYLQHLGESTNSRAAVTEAVNAVSWVQRLAGEEEISGNTLVKYVVEGFQHKLAQPKRRKEPITVVMLQQLVESMGVSPTLTEVRLAAICLLAFAAFVRFNEISKLKCADIRISEEKMEVMIRSSKTDQYRQGDIIPIARSGLPTCPVRMMESYFSLGRIEPTSQQFLFRPIISTKNGESLRREGSLSYSRLREIVLAKIGDMGYDASRFGLHSFRAGGATAAANNPELPDRLFKRHGRWRSETAKDGYVKDDEERRLSVSRKIGL